MSNLLTDNAKTILAKRYLTDGETPDGMWDRVSGGNAEHRDLMSRLLFLPNSPTLFNMGTKNGGTLSACFVFDIQDCLLGDWPDGGLHSPFSGSILGTTFKAACVAKAGGGVGYYLGNIRPEGSPVHSTHRKACGPVAVLHWLHRLRSLITQGGKRDLAQMGVLPCWHGDVLKFIHCKDEDPRALESFNISVSWLDSWMGKVDFSRESGGNDQTQLWLEQCQSAWRTGDPGMLFWDTVNQWNATPHLGDINATNPCGETPNISDEPCNLGSVALLRFLKKISRGQYAVDWDELRGRVRQAVRFLDDILGWNVFPHPDITKMSLATRKLGLGVMGWADMLAMLRIPYDCNAAVDLADQLMRTINETALAESEALGESRGAYPAWDLEKSPSWAVKCRNSTRTSIAPTGTISIIAGCEPSIEPHYALERVRTTHEGIKMTERVGDWLGDLGDFVPKVANEIALEWHVKHQAAFQRHTDLGVSKTINLPNSATVRDVSNAYRLMWEGGCKGGTVYRDGCRSEQVLVSAKKSVYSTAPADFPQGTVTASVASVVMAPPMVTSLPDDVPQLPRHKFKIGGVKGYLHVGLSQDGLRPVEVFIRMSKVGSTMQGLLDTWAVALSRSLQSGDSVGELVDRHQGGRFEPAGLTTNPQIPVCTSIPDYVVRFLALKFGGPRAADSQEKGGQLSGVFCPDCQSQMIFRGGCLSCPTAGCGFERCG
jgi:ribonucleoside-diphosphate reductase alpha chain